MDMIVGAIGTVYVKLVATVMPMLMALEGGGTNTSPSSSLMDGIVKWAAGIGGGLIALFLIVSIVKNAIGFAKGSGSSSIWKIVGEALFLILLIGLIFIAVKYTDLGNTASGIAEDAVELVEDQVSEAGIGGGDEQA